MIDQFTQWVEAYPIPEQSAETTAKKWVYEFIDRFGAPLEIHTDQGSKLFVQVCHLLQVTKMRTTPYHPSSNGLMEHFNKTLLQIVMCYVDGNHKNLPLLTAAYRNSPHLHRVPTKLHVAGMRNTPTSECLAGHLTSETLSKPVRATKTNMNWLDNTYSPHR